MKKILFTIVLAALLFNCETPEKSQYNKNEIIFVVDMNSNEGKSEDDIAEFSKYYTDAIVNSPPNGCIQAIVILIERYLDGNDDAAWKIF